MLEVRSNCMIPCISLILYIYARISIYTDIIFYCKSIWHNYRRLLHCKLQSYYILAEYILTFIKKIHLLFRILFYFINKFEYKSIIFFIQYFLINYLRNQFSLLGRFSFICFSIKIAEQVNEDYYVRYEEVGQKLRELAIHGQC